MLPAKEIQTNVYIRHPVSMEQYLMEGSYNKVNSIKLYIFLKNIALFQIGLENNPLMSLILCFLELQTIYISNIIFVNSIVQ